MKTLRIILRVLKLLVGLHDYASQKKHEKEQQDSNTGKCQTSENTPDEERHPTD